MARGRFGLGIIGALAAATMAIAPVAAQAEYRGGHRYGQPMRDGGHYGRRGYYHGGYGDGYGRGGHRDQRSYAGGRYRCRRNGTSGAIIGAIAGGLLGNAVAGYGDRTAGTVIGGGAGALAGNAIARDGC